MKEKIFAFIMMVMMVVPSGLASMPKPMAEPLCIENVFDGQGNEEVVEVRCISSTLYRPNIDVVFVVDSTGSMADEIRSVKTHIEKIVREVQIGQPRPNLRVGIVTYRDYDREESEYLFRKFDLSHNINSAVNFLRTIEANGGGDHPEAVESGLNVAINEMEWRKSYDGQNGRDNFKSKRMIFLIGDAAPHGVGDMDGKYYVQGPPVPYTYKDMIDDAVKKDIQIYTVSGSGITENGVRVWKQIADKTGGEYTHLSYYRQNIDVYYEEEGIDMVFVEEAKKDSDYDKSDNSIVTNNFGKFAKASVQAVAMEMGVTYDESDGKIPIKDPEDKSWLTGEDITGKDDEKEETEQSFFAFFKAIFAKMSIWR